MKLIIKVNKEDLDFIEKTFTQDAHDYIPMVIKNRFVNAALNGTSIPDNATNEEVAELVWGFKPRENTCIIPKTECNGNPAECDGCRFEDWWNSPYQKGGKG